MRWFPALLVLAVPASAQAPAPSQPKLPLSLARAVEIAQAPSGSLRLALARETIRQAEAQSRTALGAVLPNADGSWTVSSFTRNLAAFGISFVPPPGIPLSIPSFVGPIENYDWRASAGWNLLDWSAWQRWRASKSRLQAATAEERAARNQVTAGVVRAYTAAQRAGQMVETSRDNVALAERLLRLARSQKEAGTGMGIDVTRAEAMVAIERQRQIQAETELTRAHLELLRLLNAGLEVEIELTDSLVYQPSAGPPLVAALAKAREKRAEFESQAARERAGRLQFDAVKWERLPSAQVFGDYGTVGTSPGSGLPTRVVGVRVQLPLWDGGRRDARRAEAASILRQEGLRTRDLRQQVELEVRTAIDALRSSEALVAAAAETLALAEKELEQAQRRYREGVASGVEVTDAQTRLSRAREGRVTALYRHRSARTELALAMGEPEQILEQQH